MPFDELDGATAFDASAAGRHGTYIGGSVLGEPGAFASAGTSVHFDGFDGRVTVPDEEALRLNGDFSIEFWVRVDEFVNAFPGVFSKGGAAGDNSYILYYSGAGNPIYKRANVSLGAQRAPFPTDRFRHIVLTYDVALERLTWYADGAYDADMTITYPPNVQQTHLSIGRADDYGKQWMDEVAIYDTALSPARIAAHHDAALE